MSNNLEKFGTFGAIVAAAACPICFPKLALLGALFGFGALVQYEAIFLYSAYFLIAIALAGHVISHRKNPNRIILVLVVASVSLFFLSLYVVVSEELSYLSLVGLTIATIWRSFQDIRRAKCVTTVK